MQRDPASIFWLTLGGIGVLMIVGAIGYWATIAVAAPDQRPSLLPIWLLLGCGSLAIAACVVGLVQTAKKNRVEAAPSVAASKPEDAERAAPEITRSAPVPPRLRIEGGNYEAFICRADPNDPAKMVRVHNESDNAAPSTKVEVTFEPPPPSPGVQPLVLTWHDDAATPRERDIGPQSFGEVLLPTFNRDTGYSGIMNLRAWSPGGAKGAASFRIEWPPGVKPMPVVGEVPVQPQSGPV